MIYLTHDGFFITELETMICKDLFGSKATTLLMEEWKLKLNNLVNGTPNIIEYLKVGDNWTSLGAIML